MFVQLCLYDSTRMFDSMFEQTCNAARPEAISDGEADVILGADVQDLIPVRVRKVLCVVQQAQLHMVMKPSQRSSMHQDNFMHRHVRHCQSEIGLTRPLHTLAWMEPPRETIPVMRLAVRGMYRSSTPAWIVK